MIIAHFFLRKVRQKSVLYVETTSSHGIEQPAPAALPICEVSPSENRRAWIRKAFYAFNEKFGNLELVDALDNSLRLESDHPSFDLVFRPKSLKKSDKNGEDLARSVESVVRKLFMEKGL